MITSSCRKLISVRDQRTNENIIFGFKTDSDANAAVVGIYEQMSSTAIGFSSGLQSISLLAGLSADELDCYSSDDKFNQFYTNNLLPANTANNTIWQGLYKSIYQCNSVLAALQNNPLITPDFSRQLKGEALFLRSYFYFYLANLYGAIPLSLTTDYSKNDTLRQSSPFWIYNQITSDLISAASLLSDKYILPGERIRVNRAGAMALLSRIYLYAGQNAHCINAASEVISQTGVYELCPQLDHVFLKNSPEAILQLQPVAPGYNTLDAETFILPASPFIVAIRPSLLGEFDSTDLRLHQWIGQTRIGSMVYNFPYKYKHRHIEPLQEYLMVLRLAEQYLNRAEAYALLGMTKQSTEDINTIRSRAGLSLLAPPSQNQLLQVIASERKKELFTEWGHRWLDLKRTGAADSLMAPLKAGWRPFTQLYPIPATEILLNPHLVQNNGY